MHRLFRSSSFPSIYILPTIVRLFSRVALLSQPPTGLAHLLVLVPSWWFLQKGNSIPIIHLFLHANEIPVVKRSKTWTVLLFHTCSHATELIWNPEMGSWSAAELVAGTVFLSLVSQSISHRLISDWLWSNVLDIYELAVGLNRAKRVTGTLANVWGPLDFVTTLYTCKNNKKAN